MNSKPIVIISGEPFGVFNEIFLKIRDKNFFKKPLILIGSKKILLDQAKKYKRNVSLNLVDINRLNLKKINNKKINLIDIDLEIKKKFSSKKEIKNYIKKCFEIGLNLIRKHKCAGLINGPINKKTFLNFKFPGITEYLAVNFKCKDYAMLIFTKKIAVCPITTHLPLKDVHKSISKKKILKKVKLIDDFYKKRLKRKPKIAVTGLNPHCESPTKTNEEEKHIIPAINLLKKKKISVRGPFSADTIFMNSQIKKFDVVIGMYHDQVLGPIKALCNFDAINITLGLPFLRISPDHGPNQKMFGKNLSDPKSLLESIKFLDNQK